jgi:hypothetical protein
MPRTAVIVTALIALAGAALTAQKTTDIHPGKGGSPHVRAEWTIDGANVAIEYGRPYLKGRPNDVVMPPGREWRTGADEATTIKSDRPLVFGKLTVPAGVHTLNTVPGDAWQLVIIKGVPKWGIPYTPGNDLGRVPMTVTRLAKPVEQLTISIDDTPAGGTLRVEWGTVSARVNFTVGT